MVPVKGCTISQTLHTETPNTIARRTNRPCLGAQVKYLRSAAMTWCQFVFHLKVLELVNASEPTNEVPNSDVIDVSRNAITLTKTKKNALGTSYPTCAKCESRTWIRLCIRILRPHHLHWLWLHPAVNSGAPVFHHWAVVFSHSWGGSVETVDDNWFWGNFGLQMTSIIAILCNTLSHQTSSCSWWF